MTNANKEKAVVKKVKFSRKDGFGNTHTLICFENGRIALVNDLNIMLSLSNIMFNAGLNTGYVGEQDVLKGALRDTITDYSNSNAQEVLLVLKSITKLDDWVIVE